MKVHLIQNPKTRQWHLRVLSRNGRILASTEPMKRKAGCLKALAALKAGFRQLCDADVIEHPADRS
jgi:uncharacterized protein YegP (UPF0339 family)